MITLRFKSLTLILSLLLAYNYGIAQSFTDVANSVGINVVHDAYDVADETLSAGICWFDYDNDGDLDLYVVMRTRENYLFQNNNGVFTDVAEIAGVENADGDGSGVTAADIDNDGDLDLYVANHNQDKLYRNDGGVFTDITSSSGLIMGEYRRGITATFGDYDQDGWLDIYVANHDQRKSGPPAPHEDVLYHNNGDGTFTNATSSLPDQYLEGYAFIASWTDFDGDCDLDIFLVNDCPFKGNDDHTYLFRNDGGTDPLDWDFTEVSEDADVNNCDNGMGLAVGDYNNDGHFDYYMSDIGQVRFYENDGDGTFTDLAPTNGTGGQDPVNDVSWGTSAIDFDMDGYTDLFLACGYIHKDDCDYTAPNFLYRNNGDGTFEEVSEQYNMADSICSRSSAYGDYDNDGDADIAIAGVGTPLLIKRNDINSSFNWLKVKLQGAGEGYTNYSGIGSKIAIVDSEGKEQYWEVKAGSSNASGEEIAAIFGLGQADEIYELTITWAGTCQSQTFLKIDGNQVLTIEEPTSRPYEPFSFVNFSAKNTGNHVTLKWTGENMEESKFFTIQRSRDGEKFTDISHVKLTSTNGVGGQEFTYIDEDPLPGASFYRIRHIDSDHIQTVSKLQLVRRAAQHDNITIMPNPVTGESLTISINNEMLGKAATIYSIDGTPVKQIMLAGNRNNIQVDDLANGIYIFSVKTDAGKVTRKVVINR